MSLPFQKDNGQRKWQCFVCGVDHTDYETFKEHIIKEHEEGREYVMCPLKRCAAPIRDLKAHFKCKHPQDPIPGGVPSRAIVWKDITPKGTKTKKPKFRNGTLISTKMGGIEIHYRSGWECDVYECLESLSEVVAYTGEQIRIPYAHKGEIHDYLPDIRVQFGDGHTEIWEIKPSNQTSLEKNQDKWRAANEYCKMRGWDFIVMTEKGINKLKKKVKDRRNS